MTARWYREDKWPKGLFAPYKVRVESGYWGGNDGAQFIPKGGASCVSQDSDDFIRRVEAPVTTAKKEKEQESRKGNNNGKGKEQEKGKDARAEKNDEVVKKCEHCGVTKGEGPCKLRKCKGCLLTWFCGANCQKLAWPSHKAWCKQQQKAAAARGGAAQTTDDADKDPSAA